MRSGNESNAALVHGDGEAMMGQEDLLRNILAAMKENSRANRAYRDGQALTSEYYQLGRAARLAGEAERNARRTANDAFASLNGWRSGKGFTHRDLGRVRCSYDYSYG